MSNSSHIAPYRERVLPGLSYFAATLVVPVISYLVALPFGEMLSYGIAICLEVIIILLGLVNAPTIIIEDAELSVGKANIDRKYIGRASVIAKDQVFLERGRNLNPAAYVRFQFGVKGLVKIDLSDPKDPTPYWLVSTRNPDLVALRINAD